MRTLLKFLVLPTGLFVLIALCVWTDWHFQLRGPRNIVVGATLALGGFAFANYCVLLLVIKGKGSPHPLVAKTKQMVIVGPYAHVRNPMMMCAVPIFFGSALWAGSIALYAGFVVFCIFLALFIPGYEEKDMERRFGEEYREYCRNVPRWIPRLHAYKTVEEPQPTTEPVH